MTEEKIINMVVKAYISVMGVQKWNSLTDSEKHDAIMIIISDFNKKLS